MGYEVFCCYFDKVDRDCAGLEKKLHYSIGMSFCGEFFFVVKFLSRQGMLEVTPGRRGGEKVKQDCPCDMTNALFVDDFIFSSAIIYKTNHIRIVTLQHKTRLILKSQFNSLDSGAPKLALGG
jgi:hypothetical protein